MLVASACGGAVSIGDPRTIPFEESLATQMSGHDGGTAIAVGPPPIPGVPNAPAPGGRVLVAVFEGAQRSGGYAIRITKITRAADELDVTAAFTAPAAGGVVTQVLTSPAHVVTIAAADAVGLKTAVLFDETGTERARATLP